VASIDRTAYPWFKRSISVRELREAYSPSPDELEWARQMTDSDEALLSLTMCLKCCQRLGYSARFDEVPVSIVGHLRQELGLHELVNPATVPDKTVRNHRGLVRHRLGLVSDQATARKIAAEAIRTAAETKDNPADLINIALEELVKSNGELPGYTTLNRMAGQIRTEVNTRMHELVYARMTGDQRHRVALALPPGQARRPDLLDGRRGRVDGRTQPADQLLRLRGPRDGRGSDAARHGHGDRAEPRRLPRRQLRRVRLHQAAGLRPDRPVQADQHDEAVRAGPRRPVRLPHARAGADPIRWDVIENNYDLMMKYATAIRLRTASTEALLRRFTSETTHQAYAAMLEVGRAQRSIFLARWLRDRDLQRETESGLNVVENYNGVNDYIRFGKRGELASNRREEQELGMLCLHILQSSLGLINTLMIQDTLALPEWADVLTDAGRRGLTPIFHTNMTPYGEIQLRTDRRLDLTGIRDAAEGAR
jgi:Tn3 transposase DDE domain/Domain of unknown function (DUF4158)